MNTGPRTRGAAYVGSIPVVSSEDEAEVGLYKHCPECTARMDEEGAER